MSDKPVTFNKSLTISLSVKIKDASSAAKVAATEHSETLVSLYRWWKGDEALIAEVNDGVNNRVRSELAAKLDKTITTELRRGLACALAEELKASGIHGTLTVHVACAEHRGDEVIEVVPERHGSEEPASA